MATPTEQGCHAGITLLYVTFAFFFLHPSPYTPTPFIACQVFDPVQGSAQAEAAKLYAAEVYPDMVSRHRGRSERGRSGVVTYNSQVINTLPAADIVPPTATTTET